MSRSAFIHLTVAGKGMAPIGGKLPDPIPQHVRMHIQITRRLGDRHPRSRPILTASSLNSWLNSLLCVVALR